MGSKEFTLENMRHLIPYYDVPGDDESEAEHGSSRVGAIERGGSLATSAVLTEDLLYLSSLPSSLGALSYEESLELVLR